MPLSKDARFLKRDLSSMQVPTPEKEQTKIRRATIKILTQNMKYNILINN